MSPPTSDSSKVFRQGIVLAIVGTFLFALKSIFIKIAYTHHVSALELLTLRMLFSTPFYIIALWQGRRLLSSAKVSGEKSVINQLTRRDVLFAFLLGFLGYYLASYLDLLGLEYISAQLERLTLFTYPSMVALLAWLFLGEAINRYTIASLVLSYIGVVIMYSKERSLLSGSNVSIGVLLVLGSALSYSIYVLFAKPLMTRIGSSRFTSIAMLGSTVFVLAHFVMQQKVADLFYLQPVVYFYGALLASVCTVIPSFMINSAIVKIGAARTTIIGTVGPVLTMFLAILVLSEPSSLRHIVGTCVAILGVSLVAKK